MRWTVWAAILCACAPPALGARTPVGTQARERTHSHPPFRGGTLLVTRDGRTAVVSDGDRDAIWIVGVTNALRVRHRIDLEPGAEPWRMTEDDRGQVHVSLRGPGEVATIDLAQSELVARRPVCPAPAGLVWDRADERLVVVCEGGEVVAIAGEEVTKLDRLEPDLRDVWVASGALSISRFRAAEVLRVDGLAPFAPPLAQLPVTPTGFASATYAARVAWRTVADPDGGAWMLHQRHRETALSRHGLDVHYGQENGVIVKPALTHLQPGSAGIGVVLDGIGVLPVDVSPSPDGALLAVAFAASGGVVALTSPRVNRRPDPVTMSGPEERAVGVGWSGRRVIAQLADPPRVAMFHGDNGRLMAAIPLGSAPTFDAGRDVFHQATSTQIACASCHPEAGDDGFVWMFEADDPRRTQPLTGGVMQTAPFHWSGEHASLDSLVHSVFERRMGGPRLNERQVTALGEWLDERPASRVVPDDAGPVARGRRLFESEQTGCAECHHGPRFTDNLTHDVGTGGRFQTPGLLGLAARAPYFHNGCARVLEQRWDRCHSPGHGEIAHLSPAQRGDMTAYLLSL